MAVEFDPVLGELRTKDASSGGSTPTVAHLVPDWVTAAKAFSTLAYSTNTDAYGALYNIPVQISPTKIKVQTSSETTAGTFNLAIFSEDGQTRLVSTQFTTNGTLAYTMTVTAFKLAPGNYWVFVQPTGTANCTFQTYSSSGAAGTMNSGGSGGVALVGQLHSLTAGTMPSTFSPSSVLEINDNDGPQIRLEA